MKYVQHPIIFFGCALTVEILQQTCVPLSESLLGVWFHTAEDSCLVSMAAKCQAVANHFTYHFKLLIGKPVIQKPRGIGCYHVSNGDDPQYQRKRKSFGF